MNSPRNAGGNMSTPGFFVETYMDAVTAHAGGGQTTGYPITTQIARVTTVASAGDSVLLPLAVAGNSITVANAAAANSLNVFPGVGDAINALAVNAAYALAAGKTVTFFCVSDAPAVWHALLSA